MRFKQTNFFIFMGFFTLMLSCSMVGAQTRQEDMGAVSSNWVFSGMATNEEKKTYYYYFQLNQQPKRCTTNVILVDSQGKVPLMYTGEQEHCMDVEDNAWRVGRSFLQYNSISNNWIFGLTSLNQQGFNFKVEFLKPSEESEQTKELAKGLHVKIVNPRRMNGHLRVGGMSKEEFVTAEVNLYRRIEVASNATLDSPLHDVFCFLKNGNRFVSTQIELKSARSAAQVQLRDADGKAQPVSQFLNQKVMDAVKTRLSLKIPATSFIVNNCLGERSLFSKIHAGLATHKSKSLGFCFMDEVPLS